MGMEPAFARRPFTVLFAMPVLRHEVLRRQGKNLWLPGADDHRRDGSMIIECVAIAELTAQTVGTMNGLGRKVVSAIEGHEQLITQDAKMGQHPMVFKAFKDLKKDGIEVAWRDGIEQRADLIVTRNPLDAQQGLGVIVAFGVLQPALILQKRR